MQTDAPTRKAGGRLSREDQRRLGDILQRVYDEVVGQGVPDRFRDLLNELDGTSDTDAQALASAPEPAPVRGKDPAQSAGCDRLVEAKGVDEPGKGSHR
jgi:hypothetical protein